MEKESPPSSHGGIVVVGLVEGKHYMLLEKASIYVNVRILS
jgi:hypothetical protein